MHHRMGGSASEEGSAEHALARLAAKQHGVFSRDQAFRVGITARMVDRRLETARWEPLYPGVYRASGAPNTWRQHLLAAVLVSGEGAAASHRSAAELAALPGGRRSLEISVPAARRVRRNGVTVHHVRQLERVDRRILDAIPTTSVTRTLIDLASVLPVHTLEEALDDALRRRLTSVRRILWRLDELGPRGRRGSRALQGLLAARSPADPVTESELERRCLQLLRRSGLPLPACQYEIRARGRLVGRVDFAYPDARVAIEADGYRWHSGRIRWERDLARRNALTSMGWSVIHVTSSDLEDRPDQIIRLIAEALRER